MFEHTVESLYTSRYVPHFLNGCTRITHSSTVLVGIWLCLRAQFFSSIFNALFFARSFYAGTASFGVYTSLYMYMQYMLYVDFDMHVYYTVSVYLYISFARTTNFQISMSDLPSLSLSLSYHIKSKIQVRIRRSTYFNMGISGKNNNNNSDNYKNETKPSTIQTPKISMHTYRQICVIV